MNTTISNGIPLSVKVGGKDLITSGIIHLEQAEFKIEISGLLIEFCFKTDEGLSRYSGNIIDTKNLVIDLFNHNNSLGEGCFTPLEIGALNNKKLYLTYCASTVSKEENKRRFEFALYFGGDI